MLYGCKEAAFAPHRLDVLEQMSVLPRSRAGPLQTDAVSCVRNSSGYFCAAADLDKRYRGQRYDAAAFVPRVQ